MKTENVFDAKAREWDDEGKAYLDFAGGLGTMPLGHSHPRWYEAVVAQAGNVSGTDDGRDLYADFAGDDVLVLTAEGVGPVVGGTLESRAVRVVERRGYGGSEGEGVVGGEGIASLRRRCCRPSR